MIIHESYEKRISHVFNGKRYYHITNTSKSMLRNPNHRELPNTGGCIVNEAIYFSNGEKRLIEDYVGIWTPSQNPSPAAIQKAIDASKL